MSQKRSWICVEQASLGETKRAPKTAQQQQKNKTASDGAEGIRTLDGEEEEEEEEEEEKEFFLPLRLFSFKCGGDAILQIHPRVF